MLYRKNKQSNFSQEEINFLNNFKSFNDFYAFSASFRGLYSKVMNFAEDLKESGGMEEASESKTTPTVPVKENEPAGNHTSSSYREEYTKNIKPEDTYKHMATVKPLKKDWENRSINTPAGKKLGVKPAASYNELMEEDTKRQNHLMREVGLDPDLASAFYPPDDYSPEHEYRANMQGVIEYNREKGQQTGLPNTPENVKRWLLEQAAAGNPEAELILGIEKPENYPLYTQNTQKAPVDLTQYRRMMA